jgi:hypothetical protein
MNNNDPRYLLQTPTTAYKASYNYLQTSYKNAANKE